MEADVTTRIKVDADVWKAILEVVVLNGRQKKGYFAESSCKMGAGRKIFSDHKQAPKNQGKHFNAQEFVEQDQGVQPFKRT